MNSRLNGLPEQKRTRFLAIPHSRSMHDLTRPTIPPSRTSAIYRPTDAHSTRPVSFCPTSAGPQTELRPCSKTNRRFSELPAQLDLGLPFGSLLDGDHFSLVKGRHSPVCDSPEAFPNLSHLSHRCGTSFGSGPSETAVLSIENSSCISSAFTAQTSPIDSDGDSSIYECAALDFPEPPPIGSPVIRRMRSSPWFLSADEVGGVLSVPGRGGQVALDRLRRQSYISSMGLKAGSIKPTKFGYLKENPLGFYDGRVAKGFDTNAAYDLGAFELPIQQNSPFLDEDVPSTPSEKYLRQHDLQFGEGKENSNAVPRTEPFGGLPRIIRKVASMRSESHKTQDVPNGSTVTFQRPVPKVRSFRSLLRGSEDHVEPHRTPFKQDSRLMNKRAFFWTDQTVQTSKTRTEANAENEMQRRQSTIHMEYENNLPGTSSTGLGPYSTSWKDDLNKSFIDISPDRNTRPKGKGIVGRQRMKSLLSKANALFSWGRFQKKTHPKAEILEAKAV